MITSDMRLRALSLWRPWPWLILHGGKPVENRTWSTGHRGPLVLHAGQRVDRYALEQLGVDPAAPPDGPLLLATGLVGIVELVDCHHAHDCRTRSGPCSVWAEPDAWHWVLTRPRPLPTPIACPGRRRLFTVPPDIAIAAGAGAGS